MRTDPFAEEYRHQNTGTNAEKYASLPDFPYLLDIEICGGICNAACKFCPVGVSNINRTKGLDPEFMRQPGYMDEFLFIRVIGEIKNRKTPIRLIGWGEPTMHHKFWEFIKKANEFDILVHLNTNGLLLREMREHIDSIKLSVHSNSKRVRDGINALMSMNCYRSASITNEEAEKLDIDITKYPFTELDSAKSYRQFHPGMKAKRPKSCEEAFSKLTVFWNGDVSLCCGDVHGELVIGSLNDSTLEEIWNSEEADRIRSIIVSGKHFKTFDACKNCYDLDAH